MGAAHASTTTATSSKLFSAPPPPLAAPSPLATTAAAPGVRSLTTATSASCPVVPSAVSLLGAAPTTSSTPLLTHLLPTSAPRTTSGTALNLSVLTLLWVPASASLLTAACTAASVLKWAACTAASVLPWAASVLPCALLLCGVPAKVVMLRMKSVSCFSLPQWASAASVLTCPDPAPLLTTAMASFPSLWTSTFPRPCAVATTSATCTVIAAPTETSTA